jgi:hypothetical protein
MPPPPVTLAGNKRHSDIARPPITKAAGLLLLTVLHQTGEIYSGTQSGITQRQIMKSISPQRAGLEYALPWPPSRIYKVSNKGTGRYMAEAESVIP